MAAVEHRERRDEASAAPITCVGVGWGAVARIHEAATRRLGVRTVGVVEIDRDRHQAIRMAGLRPFATIDEAAALAPTFWDVRTPLRAHIDSLARIHALCPDADVVVEKPVCQYADIDDLQSVLADHRGRVVVNENYCSSAVTRGIAAHVARLGLRPTKVVVEMTKHRGRDFLGGRFLDPTLGAFGYEGTHLLAAVAALGPEYLRGTIFDLDVDNLPMVDSHGSPLNNSEHDLESHPEIVLLARQGGAFVGYRTDAGCRVELYTSLSGIIGYPCPPFAPAAAVIDQHDTARRYRIFRVDGTAPDGAPHRVVGFYEPMPGHERGQAAIALFRDWALTELISPIPDDTMTRHFRRIIDHFTGNGDNPCPPELGVTSVRQLHDWAQQGSVEHGSDSDHVLGADRTVTERAWEAAQFRLHNRSGTNVER